MRKNLEASDQRQLSDQVYEGGVYGKCVHIWVEVPLPQHFSKKLGQEEGCDDLYCGESATRGGIIAEIGNTHSDEEEYQGEGEENER